MRCDGFAIVMDPSGLFSLKYYTDMNQPFTGWVIMSSTDISQVYFALFTERRIRGFEPELWVS